MKIKEARDMSNNIIEVDFGINPDKMDGWELKDCLIQVISQMSPYDDVEFLRNLIKENFNLKERKDD